MYQIFVPYKRTLSISNASSTSVQKNELIERNGEMTEDSTNLPTDKELKSSDLMALEFSIFDTYPMIEEN